MNEEQEHSNNQDSCNDIDENHERLYNSNIDSQIRPQQLPIQSRSQNISLNSTPSTSPKQPIYKKKHSNYNRVYNNIYSSSQINPNYSSTNLSKINQNNQNNGIYSQYNDSNISINSIPIALPSPPLSSTNSYISIKNINNNLPLSPPYSESTSPEPLKLDYNNLEHVNNKLLLDNNNQQQQNIKNKIINNISEILPPINYKICSLCLIWYFFSIISSNSIKLILNNYKYPITVTQFQFTMNILLSLIILNLSNNFNFINKIIPNSILPINKSISNFIKPTKLILATTLPMGCFQFIGHLTSHKATSMIPVSLVHTIKALSPIVTVLIYRFLFKKDYQPRTYITLIPLSIGIMMTCYKPKKIKVVIPGQILNPDQTLLNNNNYIYGLTFAFFSMLIFVSQNIFAKNRLTSASTTSTSEIPLSKAGTKKLDNLTILFYCSIVGFIFTFPIYITSEFINPVFSLFQLNSNILFLVILNGLSHFSQSILAFQILGCLSPIDYSIANILKRIFIILISFIWELKNFTPLQSLGLIITLFGLYCYDRWGTKRKNIIKDIDDN